MEFNKKEQNTISKFLSLVLRHKPEEIGLVLDNEGWADVKELINKSNEKNISLDFKKLENIVLNNDKKRFVFNLDSTRIRANQGHSINIDLNLTSQKPPKYLFHGTSLSNIPSINKEGICKKSRQYVHLSKDIQTANIVGARHGTPIVIRIDTEKMYADGYIFFLSENNVWLTDYIPKDYIEVNF